VITHLAPSARSDGSSDKQIYQVLCMLMGYVAEIELTHRVVSALEKKPTINKISQKAEGFCLYIKKK